MGARTQQWFLIQRVLCSNLRGNILWWFYRQVPILLLVLPLSCVTLGMILFYLSEP